MNSRKLPYWFDKLDANVNAMKPPIATEPTMSESRIHWIVARENRKTLSPHAYLNAA